jgi:acyl-CoA-binding protein
MKYEIWMEGFIISGQQAKASKVGEYDADSFDDAVKLYNIYSKAAYGKEAAVKGGLLDGKTMQPIDGWTIWGCKLFDNEQDARKSFG